MGTELDWYAGELSLTLLDIRYACEQGDNMAGYGWEEYDVRTGGKQVIRDQGNHIDITTEFVKVEGGDNGMGSGLSCMEQN